MSRFFGRVGVGILVSFPFTCMLAGGVQDGFALLAISIICTAGIGLVAWIPLWWFVGWVTLLVLAAFKDEPLSRSAPVEDRRELAADPALTTYIKQATASGMDVDEITRRLRLNGWPTADILSAHESLISSLSDRQKT